MSKGLHLLTNRWTHVLGSRWRNVRQLSGATKHNPEPLCHCNNLGYLHKCDISDKCQYRVKNIPVFIRTYGCQMNVNDTNTVKSILTDYGYTFVDDESSAQIYLLMTCAIRESAEAKIWTKLANLESRKKNSRDPLRQIGLLGCMAERLKDKLLEKSKLVDIIAGPDAYRDLARLFSINQLTHEKAINCILSFDETYSNVTPVVEHNQVTSFVSITRGCDNLCSYCIVPFTRGRERSRPLKTIVDECKQLFDKGIRQVTLLGQNVNSYSDIMTDPKSLGHPDLNGELHLPASGFKTVYKPKKKGLTFDILLEEVAKISPELRIRFTSPHPKDFTDQVIDVMCRYPNISKCIHLPAQSGSNKILQKMRRGYTRETYLGLVEKMRNAMPDLAITSDFIAGFCDESDEDHQLTINLIKQVGYNFIYAFPYSTRDKTHAYHNFIDNVSSIDKSNRTEEILKLFSEMAHATNQRLIGTQQLVLVEGPSKRSASELQGRIDNNLKVIITTNRIESNDPEIQEISTGDYVACRIISSTSHTARANPLYITTMNDYHGKKSSSCVPPYEQQYILSYT